MDQNAARRAGFAAEGEATVRSRVGMGHHSPYNAEHRALAVVWLDEMDRARDAEAAAHNDASQAEQIEIARSAKDAAWAAAEAAREAAREAVRANTHATTANRIASAALAAAVIAIAVSIYGLLHRAATSPRPSEHAVSAASAARH